MAGSKSDYGEVQVLDFLVNHTGLATPLSANYWVALYTGILTESSVAEDPSEGYTGYARISYDPGSGNWNLETIGSQNRVRSTGAVLFGAKGDAGTIQINTVALVDSGPAPGTAGNIIFYDNGNDAGLQIDIAQSEQPQIPANQIIHEEQ